MLGRRSLQDVVIVLNELTNLKSDEERESHLCAHEGHRSSGLWKPLVPTDGHADLPDFSFKHLEPRVSGGEVEFLLPRQCTGAGRMDVIRQHM